MIASLAFAEEALDRGDYEQCLKLLEVLSKEHPILDKEGAMIRLLMVTAFMGKGDNVQALAMCKLLTKCKDNNLRQSASQLVSILEAPSLERPENWSIKIPDLQLTENLGKNINQSFKRTPKKEEIIHPKTGPTKGLSIGYSISSIIIIIILTVLLSK